MSTYNIGQYRYSKGTGYLSTIINKKYELGDNEYDENTQTGIKDLKITYPFKGLQTYHLKCSFNGFGDNSPQEFTLKLKTEDGKREQIIKTYSFSPTSYYNSIELAFTPKTDFSKIVFELKRSTEYDFMDGSPREMTFYSGQNLKLFEVKNILKTSLNLDSILKIGIQGPTDLIVCVNGEPIRLGQSGIFEIYKEDFIIYSIGFIIDEADTRRDVSFIMDYCY